MIKTGDRFKSKSGEWCTVTEYNRSYDIKVRFDNGVEKQGMYASNLRAGSFSSKTEKGGTNKPVQEKVTKKSKSLGEKIEKAGYTLKDFCEKVDKLSGVPSSVVFSHLCDRGIFSDEEYTAMSRILSIPEEELKSYYPDAKSLISCHTEERHAEPDSVEGTDTKHKEKDALPSNFSETEGRQEHIKEGPFGRTEGPFGRTKLKPVNGMRNIFSVLEAANDNVRAIHNSLSEAWKAGASWMDGRFNGVDKGIGEINSSLMSMRASLSKAWDTGSAAFNNRLTHVERSLRGLDTNTKALHDRLDGTDNSLKELDVKIDALGNDIKEIHRLLSELKEAVRDTGLPGKLPECPSPVKDEAGTAAENALPIVNGADKGIAEPAFKTFSDFMIAIDKAVSAKGEDSGREAYRGLFRKFADMGYDGNINKSPTDVLKDIYEEGEVKGSYAATFARIAGALS